jgi:hypothetical protein
VKSPPPRFEMSLTRRWRLSRKTDDEWPTSRIAALLAEADEESEDGVSVSYSRARDRDLVELTIAVSDWIDDEAQLDAGMLDRLSRALDEKTDRFTTSPLIPEYFGPPILDAIRAIASTTRAVGDPPSERVVRFDLGVPLRAATSDRDRLNAYVAAALAQERAGWRAPDLKLRSVVVERAGECLVVRSSRSRESAEDVARALLAPAARWIPRQRRLDAWPPTSVRYWSRAGLCLVVLALAAAPLPLSVVSVSAVGLATFAIAVLACRFARDAGARVAPTALGIAAPLVILAFGLVYGLAMELGSGSITTPNDSDRLVEPFLLSLAVATTAGFLDFALEASWVRLVAFVEMLTIIGVAGGSAYTLARGASSRLRALLADREG